jgi:hypothetical protein
MKRARKPKPFKERHKAISVDSGHLAGSWRGHFPVTSVAVMSVLERAAAGEVNFSPAERTLFVVCEFWSAFNAAELDTYFDLKAQDPTRDAREALRTVGAVQMADALDFAVLGPAGGRATVRRRQRLLELAATLQRIDEQLDLLIARFAWCYLSEQRRTLDPVFRPTPDIPESCHVNI